MLNTEEKWRVAEISIKDFRGMKKIGEGSFGVVFIIQKRSGIDKGRQYALKIQRKEIKDSYDTLEKEVRLSLWNKVCVK